MDSSSDGRPSFLNSYKKRVKKIVVEHRYRDPVSNLKPRRVSALELLCGIN